MRELRVSLKRAVYDKQCGVEARAAAAEAQQLSHSDERHEVTTGGTTWGTENGVAYVQRWQAVRISAVLPSTAEALAPEVS